MSDLFIDSKGRQYTPYYETSILDKYAKAHHLQGANCLFDSNKSAKEKWEEEEYLLEKEKKGMELLNLYVDRKKEIINKEFITENGKITQDDAIQKELEDIISKLNMKYVSVFFSTNDIEYKLIPESEEKLQKLEEEKDAKIHNLEILKEEIECQLKLAETYEQKIEVLINYDIIDKKTKKLKID